MYLVCVCVSIYLYLSIDIFWYNAVKVTERMDAPSVF